MQWLPRWSLPPASRQPQPCTPRPSAFWVGAPATTPQSTDAYHVLASRGLIEPDLDVTLTGPFGRLSSLKPRMPTRLSSSVRPAPERSSSSSRPDIRNVVRKKPPPSFLAAVFLTAFLGAAFLTAFLGAAFFTAFLGAPLGAITMEAASGRTAATARAGMAAGEKAAVRPRQARKTMRASMVSE